jgi:hypothetical protein
MSSFEMKNVQNLFPLNRIFPLLCLGDNILMSLFSSFESPFSVFFVCDSVTEVKGGSNLDNYDSFKPIFTSSNNYD